MLPARTVTKRQKKEASKHQLGIHLVFLGLIFIVISLFFTAFLEKPPKITSPLAKNQVSTDLKIGEGLKNRNIAYKSIGTNSDLSKTVQLSGGGEVVIDSKKNLDTQLSSLQLILSQLKIDGKTFKRLDFRYQKPVISF